jgi:uncharacterized membrane protein YphA (DoxX/SURF4 family)
VKKINTVYWIVTGLYAAFMLFTSVPYLMMTDDVVKFFQQLSYPAYLVPFLGAAKIAASIVILIPNFTRLKEWAYAGLTIDLVGATYSIIAVNGFKPDVSFMLLFIALNFASYYLWHLKNKKTLNN